MATYSKITDKSNGNRPIQVESAIRDGDGKNIVNNYAKQNGNYQTMTVGLAENLTPYSDEAGTEQDIPFALQGTGCGNGETVVDTGSFAQLKEKQGNSVVVNQQFPPITRSYTNNDVSITGNADGSWTINGTATGGQANLNPFTNANEGSLILNHKYYLKGGINNDAYLRDTDNNANDYGNGVIYTCTNATTFASAFRFRVNEGSSVSNVKTYPVLVDLTQWFGSNDNIPAYLLAHPESFFNYYRGSLAYNVGTLTDSNAQYLKCIGRNVWDEEWELGDLSSSTGAPVNSSTYIRSKNFNLCMPNTVYYVRANVKCYVFWYDANKNYISYTSGSIKNATTTSPSNACYYKITNNSSTYGNDITVSIYYDGESGYDQYYPYEVLTNVDTGNEVLRSAGSVKDYKEPDGTIHRLVGVVKLKDLTWVWDSGYVGFKAFITGFKVTNDNLSIPNIICNKYSTAENYADYIAKDKVIYIWSTPVNSTRNILVKDTSFSGDATAFVNSLTNDDYFNFELAEETTEEGTAFSENVNIDDFGSMMWTADDFNGVPQGCKIFYPVDYKAFVDTLTNYCDGDVNNLVLQSDLTASESARDTIDAQLKEALGGTLRQLLSTNVKLGGGTLDFSNTAYVDLGSLNWTYQATTTRFYSSDLASLIAKPSAGNIKGNILSTMYETSTDSIVYISTYNMVIAVGTNGTIYLQNHTYTDAATFKNAMKGVLLAYEKA